jgi:hypothetical protein
MEFRHLHHPNDNIRLSSYENRLRIRKIKFKFYKIKK